MKALLRSHKAPLFILLVMSGFWSLYAQGLWGLGLWTIGSAFGYWVGRNKDKLFP